jgi:hypothetical protein
MHSNNKKRVKPNTAKTYTLYTYYSVYDVSVEYPSDTFIVTILEEEMILKSFRASRSRS